MGKGSSEVFESLSSEIGIIRDFDGSEPSELGEVNQLNLSNGFVYLGGLGSVEPTTFALSTSSPQFIFSLEKVTFFVANVFGAGNLGIFPVVPGLLVFQGEGKIRDTESGETANTVLQFSAAAVSDNGLGGDPIAGDGLTNVTTQSGSAVVIVTAVPEPTGIVSTALVIGLCFLGSRKIRLKN